MTGSESKNLPHGPISEITAVPVHSDHARLLQRAAEEEHRLPSHRALWIYRRAFGWCMFIGLGALLWGYDSQISGGTLSIPALRRDFGYEFEGGYVLPAGWQSAFNSASSIGGVFGGLSVGWLADHLGRRGSMAVACVISTVGIFLQFFTPPHVNAMLLIGKLINGVALGIYVSTASGFCFELSPLALRGITTGSVNLWIVLGQLISNGVIEGTGDRTDQYAYRIPYGLQWIFPVALLIGLPFAPESPWYLVRQGRLDDAKRTIQYLGRGQIDVELFTEQIAETIANEERSAASTTYLDCFRGINQTRTIIALMVFVLQQAAGVVFVLGYSSYFFQLAGFNVNNSFKLGVGVTGIGVFGNLIALFTVHHLGRRPLFFGGMIGCTIVNFIVAFSSLVHTDPALWSMASFTIIFNFIYQVSIGPLGYVIFAEIGSAKLRSKTVAIGIGVNSTCSTVANIVIPYMINPDAGNWGGKCGFFFGCLGFVGAVWTWFFIPETKHRTVDELDQLFESKIPPHHFHKVDITTLSCLHPMQPIKQNNNTNTTAERREGDTTV